MRINNVRIRGLKEELKTGKNRELGIKSRWSKLYFIISGIAIYS
jgi:hypothetical protein